MAREEKFAAYLEAGPDKDFFVEVKIEDRVCKKKFIPTPVDLEKHILDAVYGGFVVSYEKKSKDLKEAYESVKRKFLNDDIPSINMDKVKNREINFTPDEWVYLKTKGSTYKAKFVEENLFGCAACGLHGKYMCHKVECKKGIFILGGEVR